MKQTALFDQDDDRLITLRQASHWASEYLNRNITISNIQYLLQYGVIKRYGDGGKTLVDIEELKTYYDSLSKEREWKTRLGSDVNWHLSFAEYKEADRTKHVHRLHPYKGKFIPQLVEYFLDEHTDEFKQEVYFKKGDIILDPFCGSGTTLVQANELGMHAIGIDISEFNNLICEVKIGKHDVYILREMIHNLTLKLKEFQRDKNNTAFEQDLQRELTIFNNKYFPSPEYRRNVARKIINEKEYARNKEKEFLHIYESLVQRHKIKILQDRNQGFLDKWFLDPVRQEIDFLAMEIESIRDADVKKVLQLILSRTARSSRATTHADLASLKKPIVTTYYCKKHGKICKPVFSVLKWWEYYALDTIERINAFDRIRTNTFQVCLTGDSRTIDLYKELRKRDPEMAEIIKRKKIKGIFSSPPYIGLIDYHEQHAYAYEIFGFVRRDDLEIGSLSRGQGERERASYMEDISKVLINCRRYLDDDFNIFLVANDKFNLYPKITEMAGMKIVNEFKRPVLNRVEKDRDNPYAETIFHIKGDNNR